MRIYPRLVAAEHHRSFAGDVTSSGNPEIDQLLGGGLERGTNALLIGAAGVGKSSLALTYAIAAAERGEHSVFFAFDEGTGHRRGARADARPAAAATPGFRPASASSRSIPPNCRRASSPPTSGKASRVDNARVVVIDSLNGYLNAMPDERFLILQMHELLTYLGQQGVLTILILAQHGLVGPMDTPLDLSYLSDAVLMLRYFEVAGTVRRALSVVKKRSGDHEHSIREFRLTRHGVKLGPPLTEFSGIFSGTPQYVGHMLSSHAGRRDMETARSDLRVLVFAPIGRDGPACAEILRRAGRSVGLCKDLAELVAEIEAGVGAVFVAEEGLFGKEHAAVGRLGRRASPPGRTCRSSC